MVNIKKFPRGIEVVAKSGKSHANLESDQVISDGTATAPTKRAPGPGLKHQASSTKHQAFEPTCSSIKRQASQP